MVLFDYLLRKKGKIIFSKFLNLEHEKRERIINAAIKEFAQKGFKNASTNEIVKEANISKGLLFHYFKNKKDLFLFLYEYSIEIFENQFYEKIDLNEKDILMKIRQIALVKMEIFNQYPEIFNFMKVVIIEDSEEIKNNLELRKKQLITSSYSRIFENIDTSLFKEGTDIKRAIDIIIWTMEGFSTREQEKMKSTTLDKFNYKEVLTEFNKYIELLKSSLYK